MWQHISTTPPNSSNNSNLVKWRCLSNEEEIVSLDAEFRLNVYLFTIVNASSAIIGLVSNPLLIYGVYKNRLLGVVSKALTISLAIGGLFSALVIQPSYVASKSIILANIFISSKLTYCVLVMIVAYGTKIFASFSIVTMLGITTERYVAVIYPHQYTTYKRGFLKALLLFQIILPIHFILSDVWSSYQNVSKIITALFTFVPYIFTIYAYKKIYLKLHGLDKMRSGGQPETIIQIRKKNRSFTSFLVVGTYLVCYLPLILIRSLNLDEENLTVQLYLRPWFNTLLFCSFSINALVYGWRSARLSTVAVQE